MRHTEPALLEGEYIGLNTDDPNVYSYMRRYKEEAILVVLNMSAGNQKVRFDLAPQGFTSPKLRILLTSLKNRVTSMSDGLPMEPYSAVIAKITK
jgi:glycosidase